jgi:hypothetical protein
MYDLGIRGELLFKRNQKNNIIVLFIEFGCSTYNIGLLEEAEPPKDVVDKNE